MKKFSLSEKNRNEKIEIIKLLKIGRVNEAIILIKKNKKYEIDYEILITLGNAYVINNLIDDALHIYKEADSININNYEAKYNIANMYYLKKEYDKAIEYYKSSLKVNNKNNEAKINLALTYQEKGEIEASIEIYSELINNKVYKSYVNYGVLLEKNKKFEEAIEVYIKALGKTSEDYKLYLNIGNANLELKKYEQAEAAYKKSCLSNKNYYEAEVNLAILYYKRNKYNESLAINEKLIKKGIIDKKIYCNLGNTYKLMNRREDAYRCYKKAIEIDPFYYDAINNLGVLYKNYNAYSEAEKCFEFIISKDPENIEALGNLASIKDSLGKIEESLLYFEKALKISNRKSSILVNYANLLQNLNRKSEAIEMLNESISNENNNYEYYSNLIYFSTLDENFDSEERMKLLKKYNSISKKKLYEHNRLIKQNEIKIGFISADFKNHAISNYLLKFLERVYELNKFKIYLFSNNYYEDSITKRYMANTHKWLNIVSLNDEEVANIIYSEGIDILFDLSSHTSGNRLQIFALKPSPLQISWLGYPGSTGLESMDYYISNEIIINKKNKSYFSEKILYMDTICNFNLNVQPTDIKDSPYKTNGFLTFASYNRMNKITEKTLENWLVLLNVIKNSRLKIFSFEGKPNENNFIYSFFKRNNINMNRIDYIKKLDLSDYLNSHNTVDLCLDTFPYSGSTTTLYSLFMGVPVLTLSSQIMQSNNTAYYLKKIGLDNFVADNIEKFKDVAIFLDSNRSILNFLRLNLRKNLINDGLINTDVFITEFMNKILEIINIYNTKNKF